MADYYQLLQVDRNASDEVIQAAYRTLMQRGRLHPDLGGDPALAAVVNEAYATLSDRSERAAYDQSTEAIDLPPSESSSTLNTSETITIRPIRNVLARTHECRCQACGAIHKIAMRTPSELARHRAIKCVLCAAPIPVTPSEPRRRHRYDTQLPAVLIDPATRTKSSARIVDLSDRGARLITFTAFAPNRPVQLSCRHFEATGIVQWQRRNMISLKSVYEIGIQFSNFHALETTALFHAAV